MDSIAILDFGSQYAQLIARRVRELQVYCELFPWDAQPEKVMAVKPRGFILSGGHHSVYDASAPHLPEYILKAGVPVLGICYGMQLLGQALGGAVEPSRAREYGLADLTVAADNALLPAGRFPVWMSHGDRLSRLPPGFEALAVSPGSPLAAMGSRQKRIYGLQFHPEVKHTPIGASILQRFVQDICEASPQWNPASIIQTASEHLRSQVGSGRVLAAVSGGVDSSVAAALLQHALPGQIAAVFVDTGLLRQGEAQQVAAVFRQNLQVELIQVDAGAEFLAALQGVTEPEAKRRIVGEKFVRIFEQQAHCLGDPEFLLQGTIYPDVVESSAPDRSQAQRIKTHHNVGGLPQDMKFELVEPLRYLFKDEVRAVGEALGLPSELVWRQPFPGPGLTVRCLGEITPLRLDRLRAADAILQAELAANNLSGKGAMTSQAFMVLLPVKSVGVMGDQRTYQETAVVRAVQTDDFMTADWCRLPYEVLGRISSRIVNEVDGINRVVYDITSKPPATIEWE